jgi:fermentation-respiration switch protein FrsA (DUF1100 family)
MSRSGAACGEPTVAGSGVRTEDVWFSSGGVRCRATLFLPADAGQPVPAVVLGHGLASVRTMNLPAMAAAAATAGIAAMTIDYRCLGESEGIPRQLVDPPAQREDLRRALSYVAGRPEVDADRLGLWGTSFAGGHVLHIARIDPRVRAVVSQVPGLGAWRYLTAAAPPDIVAERRRALQALWENLSPDNAADTIPITGPEGSPSMLGFNGHGWHLRAVAEHPKFVNEITAASLPAVYLDDPVAYVESVAPTPVLMIVATADVTTPPDVARAVYERIGEPKQLLSYDGDHYAIYDDPKIRAETIAAAVRFLCDNLCGE